MHGETETSWAPRTAWVGIHLAQVLVVFWILFGGGLEAIGSLIGREWAPGDGGRRLVLAAFSSLLWIRMTLTALYLLERRFAWSEMIPVSLATAMYQWGFTLLGAASPRALGALDIAGMAAFVLGSAVNTGAEWQRLRFKAEPQNRGRLYTRGLFRVFRHPNYLGDIVWGGGWAVLTHNPWAAVIVLVETAGFVFTQIPALERYLEARYGDDYRAWARHTKHLIPGVY